MKEQKIMNELKNLLNGDRWKKKQSYTGQTHWYIYKGIETIEDYTSLYEAEYHLKCIVK